LRLFSWGEATALVRTRSEVAGTEFEDKIRLSITIKEKINYGK